MWFRLSSISIIENRSPSAHSSILTIWIVRLWIGRKGLSDHTDEASTHGEQSKRLMPLGNGMGTGDFALTPAIINECA